MSEHPALEVERYELWERPFWQLEITRRELFRALGAGLLVLCTLDCAESQRESGQGRRFGGGEQTPREISGWLHVAESGRITVFTGKAEVGQDIRTSLAQVVAEELRVPVLSVEMVMADTDRTPYDAGTFGSRTTPAMAPLLRRAAAAAREYLIDLAADSWKADRGALRAEGGRITGPEGKTASYAELTRGQQLSRTIGQDAPMTPAGEWTVAGQSVPRVNAREIVTGAHRFTPDVVRPEMLHAKVLRAPSLGAALSEVDTKPAETIPGVVAVRDGQFVGIAAPTPQAAERAIREVRAVWKENPPPGEGALWNTLRPNPTPPREDIERALAAAAKSVRATYTVAYIAHAPLEPRAAVAEWEGELLTVWTGTQRPFGVRSELARAFGIPEERVRVIVPDTGSGYGGKHTGEAAVEAARIAKAAGRPVKLVWTREEELTWAYFRPAGVIEAAAGANADGLITAWDFHNYNSGGSALRSPYELPVRREEFHQAPSPLRQGSYRALAATANTFARECHMDDLAAELGMDPVAFRLKNLKEPRLRAVLEAAAERFGWGRKPTANEGLGIACGTEKGSVVATVAAVSVNPEDGQVKVTRAVTAFECGAIVNPDGLRNQVEGCVIQGLGGALFEAVHFEDGKITNHRFSAYRVPRFSDVPALETVLLDRKDLPSAGAGETPIIGIAPAVRNAIAQATGIRLRALPLAPNGVRLAPATSQRSSR